MIKKTILFAVIIFTTACFSSRKITSEMNSITDATESSEIEFMTEPEVLKIYQPSELKINKLIHTKLNLNFDWNNQLVFGEATITLSPYYYDTDSLTLDAKYFDIEKVAIINKKDTNDLKYNYNNLEIKIILDKSYSKLEEYTIFIKYVAKPSEIPNTGNFVYKDTKGFYFINPKGKKNKNQQIWTQGETEYSSCWFPTIDSPNQKCTGEIFLTVPANFVTLSNGELYNSLLNIDTTRTDHWKMELPIPPYLFMVAAGDFEVINDEWRQIEVNYYLPLDYDSSCVEIFKKTPEMIEFFSRKFGYDFPWNKYSQIVVENFVSGAMENATATVFGDFMIKDSWWYLDLDKELVIAHELSHHWFGDLVTCESWANIALNESFATYSEYLWLENQYSKEDADYLFFTEENYYLYETEKQVVDYFYKNKDDMFNTLVYQKGAKILHTLRNYVGDEAFFEALTTYLNNFEFKSAEIADFRLILEDITGEDLNWFFNQWFLSAGYPEIEILYEKSDSLKSYQLILNQFDASSENKIYNLPIDVNIYFKNKVLKDRILFNTQSQTFNFEFDEMPVYIEVDPKRTVICKRNEELTDEQYLAVLKFSENSISKYLAIENLSESISNENLLKSIYFDAIDDQSWLVRNFVIEHYNFQNWQSDTKFISKLKILSEIDLNETVRNSADIKLLKAGE